MACKCRRGPFCNNKDYVFLNYTASVWIMDLKALQKTEKKQHLESPTKITVLNNECHNCAKPLWSMFHDRLEYNKIRMYHSEKCLPNSCYAGIRKNFLCRCIKKFPGLFFVVRFRSRAYDPQPLVTTSLLLCFIFLGREGFEGIRSIYYIFLGLFFVFPCFALRRTIGFT